MTYDSVITSFISMLNDVYNLECMKESVTVSSTSSSEGEETTSTYYNPAYILISSLITELDETRKQIFASLDTLFNDPDIEESPPDMNFQIINGYADGSQTFQKYDEKTEEFSDDASYFYVRGNLYDMLPKANKGIYVNEYIENIRNIVNICNTYESMYNDYPSPPISEDGTTTTPKLEYFWSSEYDNFEIKVNSEMDGFSIIKSQFSQLISFIRNYKELFADVSEDLGKIDNFISAMNKTVNAPNTRLSDSYKNVSSSGFSMYSTSLGSLYTLFTISLELRDKSKYYATDEYNVYLRKIFTYKVLEQHDFFNTSKSYLNWIESFRKVFDI